MEENTCWYKKLVEPGKAVLDVVLFFLLWLILVGFLSLCLGVVFRATVDELDATVSVMMLSEVLMLVAALVASMLVLCLRKKSFAVLGLGIRWRDAGAGFLVAALLYGLGFGISLALGCVEVESVSFVPSSLLQTLALYLLVGVFEELMLRGFVLGRLLDGGFNRFLALFLSSLAFSAMHLSNPDFTFLPFFNLVLAGMLLGASYIYTRNLTFPIVLHWFWNWIQGPVLGYNVSGNDFGESLLHLQQSGSTLLDGGGFGFEGSLVCTVLMVIAIGAIIFYYERKRRMAPLP